MATQPLTGTSAGGSTARASLSINGVNTVPPDTRDWWPVGYGDDPAFQTRRQGYGVVSGGDYVRGSATPSGLVPTTPGQLMEQTLPHTALRYPTTPKGLSELVGQALLHVRPKEHYLKQLDPDLPPVPLGTVEIMWGWPASLDETWKEVALVRSAFGRPSTVNDGQTLFRAMRAVFLDDDGNNQPGPIVDDQFLPPGRWYHYALFFRVDEVNWVRGMVDSCLLPRDLGHQTHLWDGIPPYYQWVDDNQSVNSGPLRKFLNVFAFELDQTREFIESWQHLYDIDWAPSRLLRYLGRNFGLEYESGIGDIRYRSLLTRIGSLFETRGTMPCLEQMIEQFSKYQCDVTAGVSLLLTPDDSDFYTGTGNWAGLHNRTTPPAVVLPGVRVFVDDTKAVAPPVDAGRGVMQIWTAKADATADIGIACGSGEYLDTGNTVEITPAEAGIPVEGNTGYGYSVWVRAETPPTRVTIGLMWFDSDGQPTDIISTTSANAKDLSGTIWEEVSLTGVSPVGAVYAVPYINHTLRVTGSDPNRSPYLYVAGVMVYKLNVSSGSVAVAGNRYLTMGDPGKVLGPDLVFKGNLTGAGTLLPTVHATLDAYTLTPAPVPTAAPQFKGVTPNRAAAVNDVIYWSGTVWINAGPVPSTFDPSLLGIPT